MGDFNGDGKLDLAVANNPVSSIGAIGTIAIYLNQGSGSFAAPLATTLQNSNLCGTVLAGDVNGDGKTDLVVSTQFANQVILVLLGNGDGTFTQLPEIPGSFGFLSGEIADFNNDGHPDLFLGGNGKPYLYLGNGDGTFVPQTIPDGSFPGSYQSVLIGDFNGDKKLDAIAVDYSDPPFSAGTLNLFVGNGSGGLANPVFLQPPSISNPLTAGAADFNHDGKLDLTIGSNGAYIVFGNGDGTFQMDASQVIPLAVPPIDESHVTNPDTYNTAVADLDQNGTPDVAAVDSKTGLLSLFLNDGTGTFPNAQATPYTFELPPNTFAMAVADINGDGLPDIILSNYANNTITLLLSETALAATTVTLTGSANDVLAGTSLTFTVDVAGAGATGVVTLLDGTTQVGQQPLNASGSATFTASSLSAGTHTLTANYSGDARFASATSPALSEAVTDFQVAIMPATQTVTAGSAASYSLAITPLGGFTGTVSLACTGLPSLASCNAQTITVTSGVATQTVTVTTTAPMTAMSLKENASIFACALFGGFSLCFGWNRKTRRAFRLVTLLPLMGAALFALGAFGCGSSSAKPVPGTPSGSSMITITATFMQNGVTASHAATGTLVIQ